ncbi:hypothetical protein [Mesorhizobium sp.]|uniref:hypothetical protein n=1 Tax=Mesorhizobium sp. TaxID=1871066 RepID=UPI000FE4C17C|nr:hypothetical protein [Mesorhizobium sp.]RWN62418.1 MAG: hypothetical protein EOS00_06885 [Mesorhizobium sp.]
MYATRLFGDLFPNGCTNSRTVCYYIKSRSERMDLIDLCPQLAAAQNPSGGQRPAKAVQWRLGAKFDPQLKAISSKVLVRFEKGRPLFVK